MTSQSKRRMLLVGLVVGLLTMHSARAADPKGNAGDNGNRRMLISKMPRRAMARISQRTATEMTLEMGMATGAIQELHLTPERTAAIRA